MGKRITTGDDKKDSSKSVRDALQVIDGDKKKPLLPYEELT